MILAQGPLFKQRGTDAYRATIRFRSSRKSYIVSYQYFPDFPLLEKFVFGSGYYSGPNLKSAMKKFAEFVDDQSEYVGAIEGEYP